MFFMGCSRHDCEDRLSNLLETRMNNARIIFRTRKNKMPQMPAGVFKKTGKQNQYEFGGAMAGFLVVLTILIGAYFKGAPSPVVLELSGNVRFVTDGRPVGPVPDAVVAVTYFI